MLVQRGEGFLRVTLGASTSASHRERVFDTRSDEGGQVLSQFILGGCEQKKESSTIPISKEEFVWRNKRPRSRTVSLQIACVICRFLWVTGANNSFEIFLLMFTFFIFEKRG